MLEDINIRNISAFRGWNFFENLVIPSINLHKTTFNAKTYFTYEISGFLQKFCMYINIYTSVIIFVIFLTIEIDVQ